MRISLILTLFVISSCSTFNYGTRSQRAPASFSVSSCFKSIGSFLNSIGKSKLELALDKLESNSLRLADREILRDQASQIPYLQEREKFIKEITESEIISDDNKNLINLYIRQKSSKKAYLQKELYRPKYFGGDENFPLTFGLEFELKISENPNIVNDYRVTAISEQKWLQMSFEERKKAAIKAQKEATDIDHILTRLSSADPRLPEGLFIEPHGTIEGNGMVFENLGDFREFLDFYVERFGASSFQAHLVTKSQADLKGMTGYTIFEYEKAQLKTLEKSYDRFLKDNKATPASNLVHHSLGPIDETIRAKMLVYENDIAAGETDFLANGTKSIYAPSFRNNSPYGEGLMGFELRQFHKRYNDMFSSLRELAEEFETSGNLERYNDWTEVEQASLAGARQTLERAQVSSDLIDDFEIFHLALGDEISKQIKIQGGARTGAAPENRLLLPLLNWENNPITKDLSSEELQKIKTSQQEYINEVMSLIKDRDVSEVTKEDLEKIRIAIAKFAYNINLSKSYDDFIKNSSQRANSFRYTKLPELESIFTKIDDKEGIPVYKFKSGRSGTYKNYISNTVEILFRDIGKTGHIEVRIGNKFYSVNNIASTTVSSSINRPTGSKGRVYLFDRNKIALFQERIEKYFKSIERNNFPPFDMYGALEKVEVVSGGFKMVDSKNRFKIKAEIREIDGERFFVSPDESIVTKVITKDGQDYIQTTNCTRVVSDVFREILDFDFGTYNSAKSLDKAFQNGSVKLRPDAEFIY
ncbi:hypothetical protein [Bacteriovorax sp. Seq25_V]|uniref:hypothetical protein n=1 Tax=Bacteriovorax sp. Seq25_V TaxID=1201288 RepID=UPI000389E841|nr:hypothetical protein [Bacteriovorax sp. Seq25_V]EQC45992.1 putative lipoprotein [Bacteriovorax sp. Seq25_V]